MCVGDSNGADFYIMLIHLIQKVQAETESACKEFSLQTLTDAILFVSKVAKQIVANFQNSSKKGKIEFIARHSEIINEYLALIGLIYKRIKTLLEHIPIKHTKVRSAITEDPSQLFRANHGIFRPSRTDDSGLFPGVE